MTEEYVAGRGNKKEKRNEQVIEDYKTMKVPEIMARYKLCRARVYQILEKYSKEVAEE